MADLATLLRELDWYGAKFTATSSPEALAEKLIDTYPGIDHEQAAREASTWLLANPSKRKQYIARFLTYWFSRVGKGPQGQASLDLTTESGREASRKDADWSWENYEKRERGENV